MVDFQLGRSSEYIYYLSSANHENARISESILVYTKAIYYSIFTLVVISNTQYTTYNVHILIVIVKVVERDFPIRYF